MIATQFAYFWMDTGKDKMTYNFDPDRWYEIERRALALRLQRGKIKPDAYDQALKDLDRRYDQMLDRLDGTYQIPT